MCNFSRDRSNLEVLRTAPDLGLFLVAKQVVQSVAHQGVRALSAEVDHAHDAQRRRPRPPSSAGTPVGAVCPETVALFLHRDGAVLKMVLPISLKVSARPDGPLPWRGPGRHAAQHIGAAAFIHRFGSSMNEDVQFHVCAVDGCLRK